MCLGCFLLCAQGQVLTPESTAVEEIILGGTMYVYVYVVSIWIHNMF